MPKRFSFSTKNQIIPEWSNQYVNVEIVLLRRDRMTRGWVVLWKQHADSNLIVRSNKNPILDMHLYEMEFLGGITELTENIIAELMYAQCDIDGNEYLLLKGLFSSQCGGPKDSCQKVGYP